MIFPHYLQSGGEYTVFVRWTEVPGTNTVIEVSITEDEEVVEQMNRRALHRHTVEQMAQDPRWRASTERAWRTSFDRAITLMTEV